MIKAWSEERIIALIKSILTEIIAEGANGLVDDGAELPACEPGLKRVISCDAFQEFNDFRLDLSSSQSAGHRAIVQNLSDLAAMGAKPLGFVWSLEVPASWLDQDAAHLRGFCEGVLSVCKERTLSFFGGDLSLASGRFSCTITILGDVAGKPLGRRGARANDYLYLSKPLGASAAGLAQLLGQLQESNPEALIQEHLAPADECELGQNLVGNASACMDVSDGLSRDLHRLCRASGVGAVITDLDAAIHPAIRHLADREAFALSGGEDYALLFTAPAAIPIENCILIGYITAEPGVWLKRGDALESLPEQGFDHFSSLSLGQAAL